MVAEIAKRLSEQRRDDVGSLALSCRTAKSRIGSEAGPKRNACLSTIGPLDIRALSLAATACLVTASCLLAQVPGYTITTTAGGGAGLGNGGPATGATLSNPVGIALDASGDIYIADSTNALVRRVSTTGTVITVAGGGVNNSGVGDGGPGTSAVLSAPYGLAIDASGNIYIADAGNNRIRKLSATGTITTVAGPGSSDGALGDGGPATGATLLAPEGIAVDIAGNLYISDRGHNRVRKVSIDGTITTVAGNGSASTALGDGGPATAATLSGPTGLALDTMGNLYIADSGHARVRVVSSAGIITTIAGNGSSGYSGDGGLATIAALGGPLYVQPTFGLGYYVPQGLAVDKGGNLYLADAYNGRLRVITTDGKINTIAGGGSLGSATGNGTAASATLYPVGVVLNGQGEVYIAGLIGRISGTALLDSNTNSGYVWQLTPSSTPVFPAPSIALNGVASAGGWGDFVQLARGSWVSIYGSYLASDTRTWTGADFSGLNAPSTLDGTSVTIGGQPAYISYISPGQINAQVPTDVGTGDQPLIVSTSHGQTAEYSVTVNGQEPGILAPTSFKIGSVQYAVALFPDGATYVLPSGAIAGVPSRPAQAGDTITLYGIGFGAVTPNIPAGQIVQTSETLAFPFIVSIGGKKAQVNYAGLAPGSVGLYQFNIVVPILSSTGAVGLAFTLDGVAGSQTLYISTQ